MDFWTIVVEEALDEEGVEVSADQIAAIARSMRLAHEYCDDGAPPIEHARPRPEPQPVPRPGAWWEDRSKLSGKDWVLSGQIHALINSRYA